jgi:actin-like ATPase involved in cell morphogenesis
MAAVAGIDLGSSKCTVAIPGRFPDAGRVFGSITVLTSGNGRAFWPIPSSPQARDPPQGLARSRGWLKRSIGTGQAATYAPGLSPVETAAGLFQLVSERTQAVLGEPLQRVVLAAPVWYDTSARERLRQAAALAGLETLDLAPEPVAAVLASQGASGPDTRLLVYDLGAESFDVTLIQVEDRQLQIIGIGGDAFLGGSEWDRAIISYLIDSFRQRTGIELDHGNSPDLFAALAEEAERGKLELSFREEAVFRVTDAGRGVAIPFDRRNFEELTRPILERSIALTREVVDRARDKGFDSFDRLVLVGGAARMPQVARRLAEEFGKPLDFDPDRADLATAIGAAQYATFLAEAKDTRPLVDTTGHPPTACDVRRREPPLDVTQQRLLLAETQELLAHALASRAELREQDYDQLLDVLRRELEHAASRRDVRSINQVDGRLRQLYYELLRKTVAASPPSPDEVKLAIRREVDQLEQETRRAGQYDPTEITALFHTIRSDLERVDPDRPDALSHLARIYRGLIPAYDAHHPAGCIGPGAGGAGQGGTPGRQGISGYEGPDGRSWRLSRTTTNPAVAEGAPTPATPGRVVEMPGVVNDRVHFSITAPRALVSGSMAELTVWVHLEAQRAEVLQRAAEQFSQGTFRTQTKGPIQVARGTVLTVRVKVDGIAVRPREDTTAWEGEIGNASFILEIPAGAAPGPRRGLASVHIDGVKILRLDFVVQVVESLADARPINQHEAARANRLEATETRLRRAFASYASADRDAVLARIQGIQKGAPALDIFLDVAHLRSGDHWQERLRAEILERDVLYLFWSEAASRSTWVEWEWRCALRERGIDFIDPVPLVSPEQVPPPPELAATLHFNDWVLTFLRGRPSEIGDRDSLL